MKRLFTIIAIAAIITVIFAVNKAGALSWTSIVAGPHQSVTRKPVSIGPVKVVGRKLMVDFDGNGSYVPYFVKGVGYQPMPVGRHPSDWGWPPPDPRPDNIYEDAAILNRDCPLLQGMHANTIRVWKGNDTEELASGRFPNKLTQTTFNWAQGCGLKIIAGFWLEPAGSQQCVLGSLQYQTFLDYTALAVRNDIKNRFSVYIQNFKNHPALLFWAIGNETNYSLNENDPVQVNAFYSLIQEMAQLAHQLEGSTFHPVAFVNGDLQYIGNAQMGASDNKLSALDIWGTNVYRGSSFGTLFNDFAQKSTKPLWISETGLDSWDTFDPNNPSVGQEDQLTQASWVGGLWDEVVNHNNIAIGATVVEYTDEWWKPYEWLCGTGSQVCNSNLDHFGYGPEDTSCPADGVPDYFPPSQDNFFNEEWFGIFSIAPSGIQYGEDVLTPKLLYFTLQQKW